MSKNSIFRHLASVALVAGICVVPVSGPAVAQDLSFLAEDMEHYLRNKNSVNQAARVFGFMLSQDAAIEIISEQHPDLAPALQQQDRRFQMTFSFPRERARIVLQKAFGHTDAEFEAFEAGQRVQAVSIVSANPSRADAEAFVQELEGRTSGNLDQMLLAPILALRYAADAAGEMQTWTKAFSSANLPKATGLEISLKVPLSWKGEDGNRPHIVQKWTNQDGTGNLFIALLVHEMPGETVTFEHAREVEMAGDWSGFEPDGFHVAEGKAILLDRLPGLQLDMVGASQVLDRQINSRMRTYMLYTDQKMISLQCMSSSDSDAVAAERFDNLAPLCERVALSFTLPEAYR